MTVTIVPTVVQRLPPQCAVGRTYAVVLGFLNASDEPATDVRVTPSYPTGAVEQTSTLHDTLPPHEAGTISLEFTPGSGCEQDTVEISATLQHAGGNATTACTATTVVAGS